MVLISIYVWRTTGLSLPLLSPVISVLSLFASLARFPSPSSPNSFSVLPSDGRVFRRFSRNTLLCLYWPKFYKAQIFFFSFFQTNLNSVFINFFFSCPFHRMYRQTPYLHINKLRTVNNKESTPVCITFFMLYICPVNLLGYQ